MDSTVERTKLALLLEATSQGKSIWIRGLGSSMWPLFRSGDLLRVRRCQESDLRAGDVAVLRNPRGELSAHIVKSTQPLVTVSLLGVVDPPAAVSLGRVTTLIRKGTMIPFVRLAAPALWAAASSAKATRERPKLLDFFRKSREALTSPKTAPVRRWFWSSPEIRLLEEKDKRPLEYFLADHGLPSPQRAKALLTTRWSKGTGAAVGAYSKGRMVGVCWLEEYQREAIPLPGFWVRNLFVTPWARGLGVSRKLLERLLDAGASQGISVVHADIRADNQASLSLFESLGFAPDGELTQKIALLRLWREPVVAVTRIL